MLHPGDSVSVFLSLGRPVSLNWGDTGVIKMPHSDGVVPDQPMYMEHRPKLLDWHDLLGNWLDLNCSFHVSNGQVIHADVLVTLIAFNTYLWSYRLSGCSSMKLVTDSFERTGSTGNCRMCRRWSNIHEVVKWTVDCRIHRKLTNVPMIANKITNRSNVSQTFIAMLL